MKKIKLTQNKYALVDNVDFEYLNHFKWHYGHGYAVRGFHKDKTYHTIFMHRLIMNTPFGLETDHINRNRLDNRRENLRICTKQSNQHNRSKQKNNKSGVTGVSWHKASNEWIIQIRKDGTTKYLGICRSLYKARLIRQEAERMYYVK